MDPVLCLVSWGQTFLFKPYSKPKMIFWVETYIYKACLFRHFERLNLGQAEVSCPKPTLFFLSHLIFNFQFRLSCFFLILSFLFVLKDNYIHQFSSLDILEHNLWIPPSVCRWFQTSHKMNVYLKILHLNQTSLVQCTKRDIMILAY